MIKRTRIRDVIFRKILEQNESLADGCIIDLKTLNSKKSDKYSRIRDFMKKNHNDSC